TTAVTVEILRRQQDVPSPDARLWLLLTAAVPLAAAWIAAPAIAHALSTPAVRRERRMAPAQRREAMRYALLHWRFFERFVGPDTQWLAPDNFQEHPLPVLAMRTSPTNIGLQLLAIVSARDLGFITTRAMVERLELAFESLDRLPRFRGHFYNWYDLHDLRVLEPAYISTVDSGNLAGHLMAVRQACLSIPAEEVFDGRLWPAVHAALTIAEEQLAATPAEDDPLAEVELTSEEKAEGAVRAALAPHLRTARAAVPRRGVVVDAVSTIDAILSPLRSAQESLVAAGASAEAGNSWIGWCIRLLEEERGRVEGLTPTPVPGRAGRAGIAYPTLRDLVQADSSAA